MMKSLLEALANGERSVQLFKSSWKNTPWSCTIEQRTKIDGDMTDIKVSVDNYDPAEAVRLAHEKFFRAVKIYPELQPALEYKPTAEEEEETQDEERSAVREGDGIEEEIPF